MVKALSERQVAGLPGTDRGRHGAPQHQQIRFVTLSPRSALTPADMKAEVRPL